MIVGLDIGTAFIKTVIGEIDSENKLEIIGFSKKPSNGVRNGVIVNIDAAVAAIKESVDAAEQLAGVEVEAVYAALGGSLVEGQNSEGDVVVDTTSRLRSLEIDEDAKRRAQESSRAIELPLEKKALHAVVQEYIVDDLPGCKDPIGIIGKRLKVRVHIISASETAWSNLGNCVNRAGYDLIGVWSKTLVSAMATIHEDEQDLGSILIDLGAGSTDVIVINKGAPVYMTSIPVGGNLVTSDIALVKGLPVEEAEKIKVQNGCCWIQGNELEQEVIIPSIGGRGPEQTTQYELCQIIQPRVDEIFSMVKKEIVRHANLTKLNGSIVLTGGGALMPGIVQLAQSVWGTSSVRIGTLSDYGNLDQEYRDADFATAVGLVIQNKDSVAKNTRQKGKDRFSDEKKDSEGVGKKLSKLFKNFF
ncbi:MAG: cell division protein FtsA [Treponema sp.]|nr:cell division protein FtsA [Treponema sp.]